VRTIYKEEGVRGFFKGTRAAVVTVPIFYSLYFPIYEESKPFFAEKIYGDRKKFNSVIYTLSAVASAFTCDLITNPMWVVRIRYQTEFIHSGSQKMDSFNVIKAIRKLYRKEGFFALYRGLGASLLGIPHVIIQFNMYENLKNYFSERYKCRSDDLPIRVIFLTSILSKSI
jgi:solute carrier family 25 folate transporter 32